MLCLEPNQASVSSFDVFALDEDSKWIMTPHSSALFLVSSEVMRSWQKTILRANTLGHICSHLTASGIPLRRRRAALPFPVRTSLINSVSIHIFSTARYHHPQLFIGSHSLNSQPAWPAMKYVRTPFFGCLCRSCISVAVGNRRRPAAISGGANEMQDLYHRKRLW